jgi:hypothetical protein
LVELDSDIMKLPDTLRVRLPEADDDEERQNLKKSLLEKPYRVFDLLYFLDFWLVEK